MCTTYIADTCIAVFYRAPDATKKDTRLLLKELEKLSDKFNVVAGGDLNLSGVDWTHVKYHNLNLEKKKKDATKKKRGRKTEKERIESIEHIVSDMVLTCRWKQFVESPTRFTPEGEPKLLDVVFGSDTQNLILKVTVNRDFNMINPDLKLDHELVEVELNMRVLPEKVRITRNQNWRMNPEEFQEKLAAKNFEDIPNQKISLNNKCLKTTKILLDAYNQQCPKSTRVISRRHPWNTPELQKKYNKQKRYRKISRDPGLTPKERLYAKWQFLRLRRINNRTSLQLRLQYEKKMLARAKKNDKQFSRYVKSKTQTRTDIGPLLLPTGERTFDSKKMANALKDRFSKVMGDEEVLIIPDFNKQGIICSVDTSYARIRKAIKRFKIGSSPGPDGVSPLIIKSAGEPLVRVMAKLIEESVNELGEFPASQKEGSITSVWKNKGDRLDPEYYRPIALNNLLGKIMESVVLQTIIEHLEKNRLLNERQHGFREQYSTTTALFQTQSSIIRKVENGHSVILVLLDFSAAFDRVSHNKIMEVLVEMGIYGSLGKWLTSWLTGRNARVIVNGQKKDASDPLTLRTGVIQGGLLSPTIYNMYTASFLNAGGVAAGSMTMYADDSTYEGVVEDKLTHQLVQNDLDKIHQWAEANNMILNPQKCQIIRFGKTKYHAPLYLNGVEIPETKQAKLLGVTFESSLKFPTHTRDVVKKMNYQKFIAKHTLIKNDPELIKKFYQTYVSCHPEYSSTITFQPYVNVIQSYQKTFRGFWKLTQGEIPRGIFDPITRMKMADLILLWKVKHSLVPSIRFRQYFRFSFNRNGRLRSDEQIYLRSEFAREIGKKSWLGRICGIWNQIPIHIRKLKSEENFKVRLKRLAESGNLPDYQTT